MNTICKECLTQRKIKGNYDIEKVSACRLCSNRTDCFLVPDEKLHGTSHQQAFIKCLKQIREEHGLSQRGLAKKLGITHSTISYYELGQTVPNFEFIIRIAETFNYDLNILLGVKQVEQNMI